MNFKEIHKCSNCNFQLEKKCINKMHNLKQYNLNEQKPKEFHKCKRNVEKECINKK